MNLFVEYAPAVIIESFTMSILTAVLLKLMLDGLASLEHGVGRWFGAHDSAGWRVAGAVTLFAILFISKFLILEITQLVFRGVVQLGGFVEVVLLVVALIAAREAVTAIYFRVLASPSGRR